MPSTLISVRRNWAPAQRRDLIDAVHAALVEALRIPAHDRCIRLQTFAVDDFAVMPQCSESFTLVEVDLFPGRSLDAKRALYRRVVERLGALGIEAQDVRVVLREVPAENWGIRGGVAACDVDLGFQVRV